MSEGSLRLIYAHIAHRQLPDHNLNINRTMIRAICRSLVLDTQQRAEAAAEDIGAFLESPGVCKHLKNAVCIKMIDGDGPANRGLTKPGAFF